MPTYHYRCPACGHETSVRQSMQDPKTLPCTECQEGTMARQIKGGNFLLRGGGWYKDGYRGASNQAPAKSGAGSESTSGGGSSASSGSEGKS